MSAYTEAESMSVVRTTPGSWEGTFQVVLTAFLADVLSDGPTDTQVRVINEGGAVDAVYGVLVSFTDQDVVVEPHSTDGQRVTIERESIYSVTI